MNENFIKELHRQWQVVKTGAALECETKGMTGMARLLRSCQMFKGDENTEQLTELLKSPKGSEFCLRYNFPNIATLRHFKEEQPERFGVYIDKPNMNITNPGNTIVLAGRTSGSITIDDNKEVHNIILMAGAKAIINARGWSVVAIHEGPGCIAIKNRYEHAIIL